MRDMTMRARPALGGAGRRGLPLAAIAGLALAIGPQASEAADTPADQRRAVVASGGLMIRAALETNCLYDRPPGKEPRNILCEDTAYNPRPTRARLPVRAGGRLSIRLGGAARKVTVWLERPNRTGRAPLSMSPARRARRLDPAGRRWRIRLPGRLKGASVVRFSATFRGGGTANFGAGIVARAGCR